MRHISAIRKEPQDYHRALQELVNERELKYQQKNMSNITFETPDYKFTPIEEYNKATTFKTANELVEAYSEVHCEESCMKTKRQENGLPEIEDCPTLRDANDDGATKYRGALIRNTAKDSVVITEHRYLDLCYKATIYDKYLIDFEKSVFYKLYKWFN